ncbi:MAG: YihY/virulence factor BrkB family protein [Gemmatimonadales bacterium]|nr:YihY/virulence factor BrkB family protein [Gemmatimonadales bacterium]
MLKLFRDAFKDFLDDDCTTQAAALAYYTIFSLPPLIVLILLIAGAVLDPSDVRGALETQLQTLMGPAAGDQLRSLITNAQQPGSGTVLTAALGIGALVLGATGCFGQLQASLNRVWEVKPDPQQGGLRAFVTKRLFSFGMILGISFLLLVSLALSAFLSGAGSALNSLLPEGLSQPVLQGINLVVSLGVVTLLFAAMFKILPDARVGWKDVWVGAAVTAFLFVIGKFLIGFYLGRSNPGEAYGAAGSLAILLTWVYYAALILLFGAEFTQAWVQQKGGVIEPEPGAMRLDESAAG